MADGKELSDLIYSVYLPQLQGCAQQPATQRLLNERELSFEDLQQMYSQSVHLQFPNHLQGQSTLYICARIAYAALNSASFNGEKAKNYMAYAEYIRSSQTDYDPRKEADTLIGKITSAMLRTEEMSEMNTLYEAMAWAKNLECIQDFDQYASIAESRYIIIMGQNQTGENLGLDHVKKHLEGMARMTELGVPYDFESQKVVSAGLGLIVYQEATSEEQKSQIAHLMKKMNVQSEGTKKTIDDLVAQHPQAPPEPRPGPPVGPVPVPGPIRSVDKGPIIPEGDIQLWVTDKSQLQLEQYPFHSNTSNKFHMHIYRGIFPYSETHQFPIAVKEYHANSQEELKTFKDTEYKIMAFLSGKKDYFLVCYGCYSRIEGNRYIFGIVMEYCETNMMTFIEQRLKYNAPLEDKELYQIVYTLLEGFAFMAKYKIYHYDVKPHNIFLTKENGIKIADFNVSKIFDSENTMTTLPALQSTVQGTDGYMPPEIQAHVDAKKLGNAIQALRYRASKVDIYSLGLTFLQIHTLKTVYGFNRPENQSHLRSALDKISILWFKNLLENMLIFDYNERKTIHQLVAYLPQIDTNLGTITDTTRDA